MFYKGYSAQKISKNIFNESIDQVLHQTSENLYLSL
jgi:broad-specificity NMP kinase